MREEERKNWIAIFMVIALLVSLVAGIFKVLAATPRMKGSVVVFYTGETGAVKDRAGNVLTDKNTPTPDLLVNLAGDIYGIVANSVLGHYQNKLVPRQFNPFVGIKSLEGKKGSVLTTTLLPLSAQEAIADSFNGYYGVCYAMDNTGQILCALSLPSSLDTSETAPEACLFNKCLGGDFQPGSTMKILTTILAVDQDFDLDQYSHNCTGSLRLADGSEVNCHGIHGTCSIREALGWSCNCFFGALATELDIEAANTTLKNLGFNPDDNTQHIDQLDRATSSIAYVDRGFTSVWSLIGQYSSINPVDMGMIVGAIANGDGRVGNPYLVESIYNEDSEELEYEAKPEQVQLMDSGVASTVKEYWRDAYQNYCEDISFEHYFSKTGTIQTGKGNERALCGYMSYGVSYFIYVEENISNQQLFEIARVLDDQLRLYYV